MDALRGIQRGLDEMKAGKGEPARKVFDRIRAKHKIPFPNHERPDSIPLAARCAADLLERFHDGRVVRPLEIQEQTAAAGHPGQLGHRFL